jgi:hypothetical protein
LKAILLSAVVVICLLIGAQSAFAETAFRSGYNHGCSDSDKLPTNNYINSFGNSESHHTAEFMKGYHQGFRACGGPDAQDTSNYGELPKGQHWGTCEEVGNNNTLACDIVNDTRSTTGGLYDLKLSGNPRADFQSGLEHGKADVKASCNHPEGCHWWIRMRGNGFMNQTQEFVRGYILGFCSNSEFGSIGSIVAQASFDCDKSPQDARYKPMNSSDFWRGE